MKIDGRAFWLRVDSELASKGQTLGDLCDAIGVSYFTVNTQRKNHSVPKVEQLLGMSQELGLSVEELTSGASIPLSPEARAVEDDPELRALVRAVMRDRKLLRALSAVAISAEETMGNNMA